MRQRCNAACMIAVLMGNQYGREIGRVYVESREPRLSLLQRETAIDENVLTTDVYECAVAPATTAQGTQSRQLANSRSMLNTC